MFADTSFFFDVFLTACVVQYTFCNVKKLIAICCRCSYCHYTLHCVYKKGLFILISPSTIHKQTTSKRASERVKEIERQASDLK